MAEWTPTQKWVLQRAYDSLVQPGGARRWSTNRHKYGDSQPAFDGILREVEYLTEKGLLRSNISADRFGVTFELTAQGRDEVESWD